MPDSSHPYSALTPDCALDALDSTGLKADGRLLALNSYENRVYQMGVEDALPVVVKFYRPERWRDAAIVAAENVAGVRRVHDHLCWVDPFSGMYLNSDEDDKLIQKAQGDQPRLVS